MEDPGVSVNFLGLLIIGAIVGWLAGRVMKNRSLGVVVDLIIGIIGAFLGFWLAAFLDLHYNTILSLIFITVGAIVLFFIVSRIKNRVPVSARASTVSLPMITTIQASDAPQHMGKLQEILQNLKAENRIRDFTMVSMEEELSSIEDGIKEDDLILVLLTHQLESQKARIETSLGNLKSAHPGLRIAEIIVDNIPYENKFITFPADLRPIRDRENMDVVWNGIEESLKELFPAKKEKETDSETDWKKYLKMSKSAGKSAVIFIVLVFAVFGVLLVGIFGVLSGLMDLDLQEPGPLFFVTFLIALVVAFFLTKRLVDKQQPSNSD